MAGTVGTGDWKISGEERAKHDSQFFQLKPINGFITGDQAKTFFMQSGLPTPVLGQIWGLADYNGDGKMDKKEFSIAMHLIKKKLQGFELPRVLPNTLKADPNPVMGSFGTQPMQQPVGMGMGVPPASMANGFGPGMGQPGVVGGTPAMSSGFGAPIMSTGAIDPKTSVASFSTPTTSISWTLPHHSKLKFTQVFNSHDRLKRGYLTGVEARAILMQSALPQQYLAQIWTLSDIDRDGNLTCDEFCIAMHLVDVVKAGTTLPSRLPPELIPQSMKSSGSIPVQPAPVAVAPGLSAGTKKDAFGDLIGGFGMGSTKPLQPSTDIIQPADDTQPGLGDDFSDITFEDKRKENFDKGQAELDRRRQMLQEQLRKEEEARKEKERQEQEKKERIRQEQERRRQGELERQLEKQRQIEQEREEQRKKMLEQREAARREVDRQRQMEWERQRKEQLIAEKIREQEQLEIMKTQSNNLKCEYESLQGKKTDLAQKIAQVRNGVTDFTSSIENMRTTRDQKIADIDRFQTELQELGIKHQTLQKSREQLYLNVQTTIQNNPIAETHRTLVKSKDLKKTANDRLKKELDKIEKDTESKLTEIDSNNTENTELTQLIQKIEKDIARLKIQQEQKAQEIKRKKEDDDKFGKLKQAIKQSEGLGQTNVTKEDPWAAFKSTSQMAEQNDIWGSNSQTTNSVVSSSVWGDAVSSQKSEKPFSAFDKKTKDRGKKSQYRAIYNFEARSGDELSLLPGDVVMVPEDQTGAEPGWMGGEKNGVFGWFPKDYVEQNVQNDVSVNSGFSEAESKSSSLPFSEESSFITIPVKEPAASPVPGEALAAPDGLMAQALYTWKAKKDNHLTFNKGDVIVVKEQQDMWWSGELNGKFGWFPKSYVKLIGGSAVGVDSRSDTPVGTLEREQNARDSPVPDKAGEMYVALYSYSSGEPTDLSFNQGEMVCVIKADGEWLTGCIGERTGIFPANYVKKMDIQVNEADKPKFNDADKQKSDVQPTATVGASQNIDSPAASEQPPAEGHLNAPGQKMGKKPEIASAIATYTATGPEQLSLQPGQLILVRKKSPSGWWEGELQARGQKRKIGWFPANYVKLLGSSSARSTPETGAVSQPQTSQTPEVTSTPPPLPAPQSANSYIDQYVALYTYEGQRDDELSFAKDAIINVIKNDDPNWWKGECNGKTGLFPSNYVSPLKNFPSQNDQSVSWSDDPLVLAITSKEESQRQNAIHEIINTEESYMNDLSLTLEIFYKPLAESQVLQEDQLDNIFVNWKELIICNMKLLKSFKVRKKMCGVGQVIPTIGDILCENLPHMSPYIRYCSCQLRAAALLQHIQEKNSDFREIHKKCVQDTRTKGLPLSSFLLKPMQRITRLPLLIEKILKYTPEKHPDHQNLLDALAKGEELCQQVNEGVREKDNSDKLEWIQQHVQCEGLAEKIIFNSITNCLGPRKLLHTGKLIKAKSNKELIGYLFNDFLLLTQCVSGNPTSALTYDRKTNVQCKMYRMPIVLNEVMVKQVSEEEDESTQFQINHIERVYNLKTDTQAERDMWSRQIQTASRYYLDTEKKKREKAHSLKKDDPVGRLLVIILEGINLVCTKDGGVRRTGGVGRLLVVIVAGCDLKPSDANGKSDPYCEVSMGVQEHKTKVINCTLNPKWNASMQFTIRDLDQDVLCITVYDRDLFSPNDFLGRTEIRIKEIVKETKEKREPITKRLILHEVETGEVVIKLDLHLFEPT